MEYSKKAQGILRALAGGEAHGLEILDRITARADRSIGASIYRVLWRLERDGLIEARSADPTPERGGRPRKYYRLTDEGRRRTQG